MSRVISVEETGKGWGWGGRGELSQVPAPVSTHQPAIHLLPVPRCLSCFPVEDELATLLASRAQSMALVLGTTEMLVSDLNHSVSSPLD